MQNRYLHYTFASLTPSWTPRVTADQYSEELRGLDARTVPPGSTNWDRIPSINSEYFTGQTLYIVLIASA
jgi:hypothetical protein